MKNDIRNMLLESREVKFAEFNKKLCPDTKKEIIGIRIPILRKMAKQIVLHEDWKEYLDEVLEKEDKYFEEVIIQGLIIGYAKISVDEKLEYIRKFIPKIDSWAISDTFIPTLKIKTVDLEKVWNFIIPYSKSKKEFEIRFSVIMMLDYYINDEYVDKVIATINNIKTDKYYARMAMAWTLAEIGIKYNEKAIKYLKGENNLDKFTYNKTLQKMIESYRIDEEQKKMLKDMKI